MHNHKCPFSAAQAAGIAHCELAQEVIRRGGSEYDCTQAEAHRLCSRLSEQLISIGFAALGHVDDLTQTPKSVYDRVLLGGLKGMNDSLEDVADETYLANIWAIVEVMARRLPGLEALPSGALVTAMEGYKPPKRRGSRKR